MKKNVEKPTQGRYVTYRERINGEAELHKGQEWLLSAICGEDVFGAFSRLDDLSLASLVLLYKGDFGKTVKIINESIQTYKADKKSAGRIATAIKEYLRPIVPALNNALTQKVLIEIREARKLEKARTEGSNEKDGTPEKQALANEITTQYPEISFLFNKIQGTPEEKQTTIIRIRNFITVAFESHEFNFSNIFSEDDLNWDEALLNLDEAEALPINRSRPTFVAKDLEYEKCLQTFRKLFSKINDQTALKIFYYIYWYKAFPQHRAKLKILFTLNTMALNQLQSLLELRSENRYIHFARATNTEVKPTLLWLDKIHSFIAEEESLKLPDDFSIKGLQRVYCAEEEKKKAKGERVRYISTEEYGELRKVRNIRELIFAFTQNREPGAEEEKEFHQLISAIRGRKVEDELREIYVQNTMKESSSKEKRKKKTASEFFDNDEESLALARIRTIKYLLNNYKSLYRENVEYTVSEIINTINVKGYKSQKLRAVVIFFKQNYYSKQDFIKLLKPLELEEELPCSTPLSTSLPEYDVTIERRLEEALSRVGQALEDITANGKLQNEFIESICSGILNIHAKSDAQLKTILEKGIRTEMGVLTTSFMSKIGPLIDKIVSFQKKTNLKEGLRAIPNLYHPLDYTKKEGFLDGKRKRAILEQQIIEFFIATSQYYQVYRESHKHDHADRVRGEGMAKVKAVGQPTYIRSFTSDFKKALLGFKADKLSTVVDLIVGSDTYQISSHLISKTYQALVSISNELVSIISKKDELEPAKKVEKIGIPAEKHEEILTTVLADIDSYIQSTNERIEEMKHSDISAQVLFSHYCYSIAKLRASLFIWCKYDEDIFAQLIRILTKNQATMKDGAKITCYSLIFETNYLDFTKVKTLNEELQNHIIHIATSMKSDYLASEKRLLEAYNTRDANSEKRALEIHIKEIIAMRFALSQTIFRNGVLRKLLIETLELLSINTHPSKPSNMYLVITKDEVRLQLLWNRLKLVSSSIRQAEGQR